MESTPEVSSSRKETNGASRAISSVVMVEQFARILCQTTPETIGKDERERICRKVMQGIQLMHSCRYKYADVMLTLAYASTYIARVLASKSRSMLEADVAHVCVLCMYLAQSFVLDKHTRLSLWHKHVFRKTRSLTNLNSQLFSIFQTLDFKLRLSEDEENYALSILLDNHKC
eukprot:TRINITY_DN94783_c0_g1_i1.p1 TRINITY_DN94783_c0_g1~~TRINITY_DN94783_c0_g1_i1.p1  ORF type:complete len:173 (+),score=39.98 TRINITY_DN94783_c0_g1_i1:47-565(+)